MRLITETIEHKISGGALIYTQEHNLYVMPLHCLHNNYSHTIPVLSRKTIRGIIPRLKYGPWMKDIEGKGSCSVISVLTPEVELLIGVNTLCSMITGDIIRLDSGLIVAGKLWKILEDDSAVSITNSLCVPSASLKELWELECIGINYPAEILIKKEMEMVTMKHF
ncbi:hypothetical protein PR048_005938 [Dryococelus australis]|uniref:Uncharacterized protein n=1 Tax=Dryococelus australis TaxID=614101 RepID=A0ABQ9IA59_9NEOP|nr:hypothetical protein PR048_005938 [Dryococelus australis]